LVCSSSDPIRWRPSADPGQKKDPGDGIKAQRDSPTGARDRSADPGQKKDPGDGIKAQRD
jgi:hypothetical protein